MAVRFDANGDKLTIFASMINNNQAYTVCAWVRPRVLDGVWKYYFLLTYNLDQVGYRDNLIVNLSNELRLDQVRAGSGVNTTSGAALTVDQWTHLAMRRNSQTSLQMLRDGAQVGSTITTNCGTTNPSDRVVVGMPGDWDSSNGGQCAVAALKMWQAALTDAEIAQEMATIRPSRFANLVGWWPLFPGERTIDFSGNGRTWSEVGTLSDEDGPPVSWGA